jgi:hypothetical protein
MALQIGPFRRVEPRRVGHRLLEFLGELRATVVAVEPQRRLGLVFEARDPVTGNGPATTSTPPFERTGRSSFSSFP